MPNHPSSVKPRSSQSELMSPADFRVELDRELAAVYAEWLPRAQEIDSIFAELLMEMASFVGRGGKRMRPYLCYLGYVGSGGKDIDEIIRVAVSQELYHNAWLIHDDIIDHDVQRYGGLNITGVYLRKLEERSIDGARHLAEATALIAGNVNMALAVDTILSSTFPAELKVAAARHQQSLIVNLAGGEMLDVYLPLIDCSEVNLKKIISVGQYKTSTYSFQSPLQIGAILAGASIDAKNAINPYAIASGIAFQLTDDVLGIFGEDDRTGKSNLSDIREGKRTLLVLETMHRASPDEAKYLRSILGDQSADMSDLEKVRSIMISTGGFDATKRIIRKYVRQAVDSLPMTSLTVASQVSLSAITNSLLDREA